MKKDYLATLLTITGLGITCSNSLMAIPYASSNCNSKASQIKHPDNAQGVFFDEECKNAYVLPPATGKTSMTAVAGTTNLNFCPAMLKIPETVNTNVNSLDLISKRLEAMIADYQPQEQELVSLREERDNASIAAQASKRKFEQSEQTLEDLKKAQASAKKAYDDCITLSSESECKQQKDELFAAKNSLQTFFASEYRAARDANDEAQDKLESLQKSIARKTSNLAELMAPATELLKQIEDIRERSVKIYDQFADKRAITGQVEFNVEWDKIINAYAEQNKTQELNFVRMPILSAKIHSGSYIDRGTHPVLLSSFVPGAKGGTEARNLGPMEMTENLDSLQSDGVLGFGDAAVSGQLTLSLLGACPYFPEGLATEREGINFDEMSAYLTVNAEYDFPVKARRQYVADYHLSQMMYRFERKHTKGGFFSSKSIHEVVEDSDSHDWFRIDFDQNDPDFNYTPQEQSEITREVKAGLIERALRNVAMTTFNGGTAPALIAVPTNGAAAAQSALNACGFLWYCRLTSGVLGVLNSIFGSSEAISTFRRNNDTWTKEEVKQVAVLRRTTGISFSTKR